MQPCLAPPRQEEGVKKVPLEVRADVKHTTGVLSMGRFDDPNSGTSSFSILLGSAPHLDMQVARVWAGWWGALPVRCENGCVSRVCQRVWEPCVDLATVEPLA